MATRAPSFARRVAMPRPMPRLPPVTKATRFRKDIRPSPQKLCTSIAQGEHRPTFRDISLQSAISAAGAGSNVSDVNETAIDAFLFGTYARKLESFVLTIDSL